MAGWVNRGDGGVGWEILLQVLPICPSPGVHELRRSDCGAGSSRWEPWFTMRSDPEGLSCEDGQCGVMGFPASCRVHGWVVADVRTEFMDNPADSFKEADVSAASYVLKDTRIGFANKAVTCMNVL